MSLPAAIRRRWGTRRVVVEDRGDHAIVRPVPDDPIAAFRGSIKGGPTSDEIRAELRREEAEREERRYGRR